MQLLERERTKTALSVGLERWQTGTWEVQPYCNYTDTQLFKMFSLPTFLVRSYSNGASYCVIKELPCTVIIPPPPVTKLGRSAGITVSVWPSVQALFRRTSLPFVTGLGIVKWSHAKEKERKAQKKAKNSEGKKLGLLSFYLELNSFCALL